MTPEQEKWMVFWFVLAIIFAIMWSMGFFGDCDGYGGPI